ncbi:MAG: hypothetical protein IZT59_07665 [Verrucomicrobia bacterium]|nr:hypothetical protein [Verrucomicrobiota bacterium]
MPKSPISPCSVTSLHGPGRGCKDALREVESHVVDVDIRAYFDNIPHDELVRLVR